MIFECLITGLHQALAPEHNQEAFGTADFISSYFKSVIIPLVVPKFISHDTHTVRYILELMVFIILEFPFSKEGDPFLLGFLWVIKIILKIGLRHRNRSDPVQQLTDTYINQIDELTEAKEAELLET